MSTVSEAIYSDDHEMDRKVPCVGLEQPAHTSGKTSISDTGGAESGAPGAQRADIEAITDALDGLPEAEAEAIVHHVRQLVRLSTAKREAILTITDSKRKAMP